MVYIQEIILTVCLLTLQVHSAGEEDFVESETMTTTPLSSKGIFIIILCEWNVFFIQAQVIGRSFIKQEQGNEIYRH